MTNWYTDELSAGIPEHGATFFVNGLSRLVFDPERFLDDAAEPTSAWGQGVVYTHGRGTAVATARPELRDRRIEELYRPYHAALDAVVAEAVASFGACTLIDCHSFPTLPCPVRRTRRRIGRTSASGPMRSHPPGPRCTAEASSSRGLSSRTRSAFSGACSCPVATHHTDARVHSVMIEVRRGLYMDETSGQRSARFEEVGLAISRAVEAALQR